MSLVNTRCLAWQARAGTLSEAHRPVNKVGRRTHSQSQTSDASIHGASSFFTSQGAKTQRRVMPESFPPRLQATLLLIGFQRALPWSDGHHTLRARGSRFQSSAFVSNHPFDSPEPVPQLGWLCCLSCSCFHVASFGHYLAVNLEMPCTESACPTCLRHRPSFRDEFEHNSHKKNSLKPSPEAKR